MSIRLAPHGTILLEGACPVDDAETLRQLLLENPVAPVDWRGCEYAHTAIVQVLLAAKRPLHGPAGDRFLERWVAPLLCRGD